MGAEIAGSILVLAMDVMGDRAAQGRECGARGDRRKESPGQQHPAQILEAHADHVCDADLQYHEEREREEEDEEQVRDSDYAAAAPVRQPAPHLFQPKA